MCYLRLHHTGGDFSATGSGKSWLVHAIHALSGRKFPRAVSKRFLNFQTWIADLTALDIANASLARRSDRPAPKACTMCPRLAEGRHIFLFVSRKPAIRQKHRSVQDAAPRPTLAIEHRPVGSHEQFRSPRKSSARSCNIPTRLARFTITPVSRRRPTPPARLLAVGHGFARATRSSNRP